MALPDGLATYVWVALCSVGAPALFGFGLVRWLGVGPAHGWRTAWGLGYVVGHYVLAQVTLAWLVFGQPGPGCLLPIAAAAAGWSLVRRAGRRTPAPPPRVASPWWSWLPVVLLSLFFVDTFLAVDAEPIRFSDEAVNWAAKAKVLYTAPGFELKTGLDFFVEHADYPPFQPLVQVLAFASAGRVLHYENRLPVQFFAIALLLLLSAATTRRAHPLVANLALLAFAGTSFGFLAPTAYADVVLACAVLAAAEALLRWRETGERAFFGIACIALAAAISTKNEGLLLAAAVAAPFAIDVVLARLRGFGWRLGWRSLPWLAVPFAALALHRGLNAWFSIQNDLTNPALGKGRGLAERIVDQASTYTWPVLGYYGRMLVDAGMHRLLPLAFLIAAPLALLAGRRAWLAGSGAFLFCSFVCATAGYIVVFVGTIYDLTWHLDVAADRTMQHVLPLVVVGLTASVWPRGAAAPPAFAAAP